MLTYEYHDALIEAIDALDEQQFELTFFLYSIFYPDPTRIKVRLVNVFNHSAVRQFFEPICAEKDLDPAADCLAGCLSFKLDTKRASAPGSIRLYLSVNGFGSTRIHCQAVTETVIPNAHTGGG